jgi:hypothetical protein
VSPRRPTKDPLDEARAFADEAELARDDWQDALVGAARMKLDEAGAGIADGEAALLSRADNVAEHLKQTLERRRAAIAHIAGRLAAIERGNGGDGR